VRITEDIDSPANWLTKRQIQELEFHLKSRIKDKIAAGGHKGPSEPGVQEQFKEMDLSSLSTELSYFDLNNYFVVEEFCRILSQHSEIEVLSLDGNGIRDLRIFAEPSLQIITAFVTLKLYFLLIVSYIFG